MLISSCGVLKVALSLCVCVCLGKNSSTVCTSLKKHHKSQPLTLSLWSEVVEAMVFLWNMISRTGRERGQPWDSRDMNDPSTFGSHFFSSWCVNEGHLGCIMRYNYMYIYIHILCLYTYLYSTRQLTMNHAAQTNMI